MSNSVIGIVDSSSEVETIVHDLERSGVAVDDIVIACPDEIVHSRTLPPHILRTAALSGTGLGCAVGTSFGLLASLGGLALPGLEVFIVAGPIVASLSAGAAGAALGCVGGWMLGDGAADHGRHPHVRHQGNILIAVQVDTYESERLTESILLRGGAHDVVIASEGGVGDLH